jgi:hypothetical protein
MHVIYQQSKGGFMKLSGFAVKVVNTVCVAGIVLSIGVMCQKPKGSETLPGKCAGAATVPAAQASAVVPDTSVKKADIAPANPAADTVVKAAEAGYYTCPMHPQINQTTPGKCPICKMDLVFKKAVKTTASVKSTNHTKK